MASSTAIEVRDLHKGFRIPDKRTGTLRQTALRPFMPVPHRELRVLEGISFDVDKGEFFGVVGRNGCGKSTLLKLLASIYRADSGRIRIAGRVAPFIELGVGFRNELPAFDNVVLNGVMMGLTPRQARDRFDEIMAFADLEQHGHIRLKNYSSGMRVRLAFAIMAQIRSDVLLIDEVLAVGDSAFAQKCERTFEEMIDRGTTIVLVTHSMSAIRRFCQRALLIADGGVEMLGPAEDVAARYTELNFERKSARPGAKQQDDLRAADTGRARVADAWFENAAGARAMEIAPREPIELHAVVEALRPLSAPAFGFELLNDRGRKLFAPPALPLEAGDRLEPGERLHIQATIENPLASGAYVLNCGVFEVTRNGKELPASTVEPRELTVSGSPDKGGGALALDVAMRVEPVVVERGAVRL